MFAKQLDMTGSKASGPLLKYIIETRLSLGKTSKTIKVPSSCVNPSAENSEPLLSLTDVFETLSAHTEQCCELLKD